MEKMFNRFILFPNYFKKIGIGILIVSFFISIILKKTGLIPIDLDLALLIHHEGLIIGLLIIAFSKDKLEDELTTQIRIHSLVRAFLFVTVYFLVSPIVHFFTKSKTQVFNDSSFILVMILVFYLFMFYRMKKLR